MTRCTEFYERWERTPNFCELGYHSVRLIDNYLKLVEVLASCGVKKETVLKHISEGAARYFCACHKKEPHIGQIIIEELAEELAEIECLSTQPCESFICPDCEENTTCAMYLFCKTCTKFDNCQTELIEERNEDVKNCKDFIKEKLAIPYFTSTRMRYERGVK